MKRISTGISMIGWGMLIKTKMYVKLQRQCGKDLPVQCLLDLHHVGANVDELLDPR